ncbi:MAG: glycerol-3-phosphate 1-O-acyltransferase PlsY [Sphingobium sp.]|nr:glycerol-3-phosphate 1-O-acyltransferase PlsY [Sphingobium sp.]
MTLWQMPALVMAIGYLIGSIPFGILLTRAFGAGDLRAIGSGSIGATNVLRTGRKGLAAATLLLDLAKGAVAVLVGAYLLGEDPLVHGGAMAGVMAFIGHCYPVWLRFRGGKGVATMMGVCVALMWQVGFVFAVVWIGMLAISRISSAGGICAGLSAPIACLALGRIDLFAPVAAMALILLWRHRSNISRLLKGQEPRIGSNK